MVVRVFERNGIAKDKSPLFGLALNEVHINDKPETGPALSCPDTFGELQTSIVFIVDEKSGDVYLCRTGVVGKRFEGVGLCLYGEYS